MAPQTDDFTALEGLSPTEAVAILAAARMLAALKYLANNTSGDADSFSNNIALELVSIINYFSALNTNSHCNRNWLVTQSRKTRRSGNPHIAFTLSL
jgi:hypothetical protein